MTWEYRVMRSEEPDGTPLYAIHEVYYGKDGTSWTEDPVSVLADTHREILLVLAMMADAVGKPTLDFADGSEIGQVAELSDSLRSVLDSVRTEMQ